MDLVYVYKESIVSGSEELRYSLRSAQQHLTFDRVFLFGSPPDWLQNAEIVETPQQGNKIMDVSYKIQQMVRNDEISDDFIFMNDDFFLLQDYPKIPYYYNLGLREWKENYPWNQGTHYYHLEEVYSRFPDGKYFEVHFPIVYNKDKLKGLIEKYNLSVMLMLRSYYGNEYKLKAEPTVDYKIYVGQIPLDAPFISTTDLGFMTPQTRAKIKKRFPNPSQYERVNS